MLAIKQKVLRLWDHAVPSVRISCIKFAQRVVLAQTVSTGAELRVCGSHVNEDAVSLTSIIQYVGTLDVSLDKVPPNHSSLDPRNLEAEASGLLDRILGALQDSRYAATPVNNYRRRVTDARPSSDALVVDATLNCLSIVARTRPATSSRILNALLNFNPLQLANSPLTPRTRVMIKSMEKTSRLLLNHLSRRDPHGPLASRIQQHIERSMRTVVEILDDAGRKRPLDTPQHDGYDAKRQRTGASHVPQVVPLGAGSHSLADLFTLVGHEGLKSFDISQVPAAMAAKVTVTSLAKMDAGLFAKAIDGVRSRLETLANAPAPELNPNTAPLGVDDDDDDYEPDFYQAEDTEQLLNKLDGSSPGVGELAALDATLGLSSFTLPQPPQLTPEMALSAGTGTVAKVVNMMKSTDDSTARKATKTGFSRLAASSGSKDAWTTILTRLATRSATGLDEIVVKGEEDEAGRKPSLSNNIRETLYSYVMEDFRRHIDVAVAWLCEEWYNDKMLARMGDDYPKNYEKNALRLIDGFLPYLAPQDNKVLTRFLSEIPELGRDMLSRVKSVCRDPSVTQLALTSLLYLAMMRPPVKEMALDTVQDIWIECK